MGEHRHHNHGPLGRLEPGEIDLDAGTKGRDLTGVQAEFHTAPAPSSYPKGIPDGGLSSRDRGDTVLRKNRLRNQLLEHIADANNPDASPIGGDANGAAKVALLGGAMLGPVGAALGAVAGGVEVQFGKNYYTLASLPGHLFDYLEENTDIPFSKAPKILKQWTWDAAEHVFPEFTKTLSFVMTILLDNFEDPEFTKVVPSEHWWQADRERALEGHEIFGSSMERAGNRAIRSMNSEAKAQFFHAAELLGKQFGGEAGLGGLVAFQSPLNPKGRQIELAVLGSIVGDRLDDYRGSVGSDGIVSGVRMKVRGEGDTIETVTRDIDLKNRDDLAEFARSLFLDTKYERLKTTGDRMGHGTAADIPPHDPHADEVEAETRKGISATIPALFAAAKITPEQFLNIVGEPNGKGPDGKPVVGLGEETDSSGNKHFVIIRKNPDGVPYHTPLYEEKNSKDLEVYARKLETVKGMKDLEAKGEGLSQEEMLKGIDMKNMEVEGFKIDEKDPGVTFNPETISYEANFVRHTEGGEPERKRISFDPSTSGMKKLEDKVKKRVALGELEHEMQGEKRPAIHEAMLGAVAAVATKYHPEISVAENKMGQDKGHLEALGADGTPQRLDSVLSAEEFEEAKKTAEKVHAYALAAEARATAPEPVIELDPEALNERAKKFAAEGARLEAQVADLERLQNDIMKREGEASSGEGKLDAAKWAHTQALIDAIEKGAALSDIPEPEDAAPSAIKPGKTPGINSPGGRGLN